MSKIRLLLIWCALGVLSLIPGARTQASGCPVIQTEELGSTSAASTTGLISQSYINQRGDNPPPPNVQLFASNVVCLAAARTRGLYRSVSLIANFSCSGSACMNNDVPWQITQFHFECNSNTWIASLEGSADFIITESPVGNLSTMLRRDCSLCIEPQQMPAVRDNVDATTHCLPCPQSCTGTGTCFSALPDGCCNFYDRNGTCVTVCPNGEVPDNQNQCSVAGIIVGFEFASYSFSEGAGVVTVTINSSAALPPSTTIQVDGGSVMQPSTVIVSGPAVINQTLMTLPATVSFTINDDNTALETVEEFSISLSSSDPSVVIGGSGLFGVTQISITDDDVVVVGFRANSYTFEEADAQVVVQVLKSNFVARNFEILINKSLTSAGPFVRSSALPVFSERVEFGSGATSPFVNVAIMLQNDNIALEGTERVVLNVVNVDSDSRIVVGGSFGGSSGDSVEAFSETELSILDDDPVRVSFLRSRQDFVEDTRATPIVFVQLTSLVARDVTVQVVGDPTAPPLPFVFPSLPFINSTAVLPSPSSTTSPTIRGVSFQIMDDTIGLEDEEVTVVQLRVVDPDPSGFQVIMEPFAETQVAVLDNEFVRVGFQMGAYTVSEADGAVEVCVVASSITIRPINFTVDTQDETAQAGEDYVGGPFFSSIAANTDQMCVQIQVIQNPEMEVNETFSISLTLTTVFASGLAPDTARATATITITDAPPPAPPSVLFTFRQPMITVLENVGAMGQACVERNDTTSRTYQLSVTFSNTGNEQTLEFEPDDIEQCVSLQVQDDNVALEETDVFTLSLGIPAGQPGAGLGQPNMTMVMVLDDDELVISVRKMPEIPENVGTTLVCVQFSSPFAQPFQLLVQTMELPEFNMSSISGMSSATPGVDYRRINQTLDVSLQDSDAGETCFNITIEDDSVAEETMECLVVVFQLPENAPAMVRIAPGNESTICCILDDDEPAVFTQCVVRSTLNDASDITTFEEAIVYPFNRTCEHYLVTSCDALGTDFSIRIDQLDGQLFTSRVGVYYRNVAAVFRAGDIDVISGDPSQYEVLRLLGGTTFILRELGNLSVSYVLEALAVSVRVRIDTRVLPNACGLCGNTSGQTVLRDSSLVDVRDEPQLQQFVDEYFVNPGETRLRQIERLECGLIRNDTIIGDPLFTVPISGLPDGYLCYEIHGQPSEYFNLISDECVSVNARYAQRTRQFMSNGVVSSELLNVIDQIGIRAVDNNGQCVTVTVNVSGCAASVNGVASPFYSQAGVRVRQFTSYVRVAVPNCADTNLVMRVFCQNISGMQMIKFVVSRGLNIRETAHGLIGQFWNIPFSVQQYTGVTRDGSTNVYIITVTPPEGEQRAFAAWSEQQTWDGTNVPCLYAGNRQGGPVYEVQDPNVNDPLIEGTYKQYEVDGPFATQFEYSHFNEKLCR